MTTSKLAPDMVADIRDFHEKFGLEYNGKPRMLVRELSDFRRKFMLEEFKEYCDATDDARTSLQYNEAVAPYLEQMLDGLVDLVYVALGTAHLHGFDFNEAWRRVHEANMKKVRAERPEQSKRGTTFDVVKPPGWKPSSLRDLVDDYEEPRRGEV